jgi:enoyl-CoA hydratase/carnithine racemase
MSDYARLTVDGSVATLSLNRPAQHNALSVDLLDGLHECVDELERLEDVSVLVITGEGRSFCAGMDLKAVVKVEGLDWPGPRLLESLGRLTVRIRALAMVTVAKVNGAAIGGGCGLSCVADISISHADAKLGFPEVDLGICPAVVAPWVVRKLGMGRARVVLLSGGLMSGVQAQEIGLVDHLADERTGLDGLTSIVVERLAAGGHRALRATRGLLNELDGSLDESVILEGAKLSAQVLGTAEAQASLRARMK